MLEKIVHFFQWPKSSFQYQQDSRESLYKLGIIYFGVKVQKNFSVAQLVSTEDLFYSAMYAASLQLRDVFYKKIGIPQAVGKTQQQN